MPDEQFLKDPNPVTITVSDKRFNGEVMTIREMDFDPKLHIRVNSLGQRVNEHGIVIENEPIAGPGAKASKEK